MSPFPRRTLTPLEAREVPAITFPAGQLFVHRRRLGESPHAPRAVRRIEGSGECGFATAI